MIISMRWYKKLVCAFMTVLILVGVMNVEAADNQTDLLMTLDQAETIKVKRSWFSFNKDYKVYVDGQKVGKVEGLYFNLFGERLVLSDLNGQVYGSEQQIKRWNIRLNRLAQVYNGTDETVGFIGEQVIQDFFRLGHTFHFYDQSRREIAVSKEKIFRLFPEYIIEDNQGNKLYKVKKKFSFLTSTYEITNYDSSVLPVEQAVFLTCILDAIKASESEE